MTDTIFALSSGSPPAAIAVVRVSGPGAGEAAVRLAREVPPPRRAVLRTLRDASGAALDHALTLFFPGPRTATGEDVLELHCHGGRGVVDAVIRALAAVPGFRHATPGEFTRRALENGIIDFAQAESLADLLAAQTEEARTAALAGFEGAVGQRLRTWSDDLATIRAIVEVAIDYDGEGDLSSLEAGEAAERLRVLTDDVAQVLARPTVERLHDGPLIVLAGPPNAGKSSLLNALCSRDVSIVTPIAGTTRDAIEVAVTRNGCVYRLVDTAGLTEASNDPVEQIGIARARRYMDMADLVLWLGEPELAPAGAMLLHAKADVHGRQVAPTGCFAVSIYQDETVERLWSHLHTRFASRLDTDRLHFRQRQRESVAAAQQELVIAVSEPDHLLMAEHLRCAASMLSESLHEPPGEAMLDALFSRYCLGK